MRYIIFTIRIYARITICVCDMITPFYMFTFMRLTNLKLKAIFELKPVATTSQVADLDRSKAKPLIILGPNLMALAILLYTGSTAFQNLPIHRPCLLYMVQNNEEIFAVGALWSSPN